jgi:putative colanic acid biosynthesis acetyltransferase WcaF
LRAELTFAESPDSGHLESRLDLSSYNNAWYSPGRNKLIQALWYFAGAPLVRFPFLPSSAVRGFILRCFGARLGRGVVLMHGIRVKYPWHLAIGDCSWIGEDVWIDNLVSVRIGAHVCISQGAYLCTGNHDWSDPCFGLLVQPIELEEGSWVGTHALICPGVTVARCGVAAAGSVITKSIPAFEIHAGNPARFVKRRVIRKAGRPLAEPVQETAAASLPAV